MDVYALTNLCFFAMSHSWSFTALYMRNKIRTSLLMCRDQNKIPTFMGVSF